ncbi:OsmC family peroxiredoxin [Pontibacillus yanchengensis]|uniref:OsmC family peroxiredoxin n=2 Tax=Pontibacillus yanchengensis TaxID=462910 RepID=A0ACC7VJX8_9BACI|nr:OsmC family protein [Pontibacillus yanchengensis]MYL35022.1 OsmC family peroxiredoxin [Pontibacillus yanchengensis]MYL55266.1 OsmC family peroxiredoxin [Pontibacillus yanchengensis]
MAEQTFHVKSNSKGLKTDIETADQHKLVIDEPEKIGGTNEAADPLSTLLSSLAGCETVVANFVAKEIGFDLQSIDFDIKGSLDPRGLMGTEGVRPYFQTVTINAKVHTSESQERINELQRITDERCPVYTTLQAADVQLTANWEKA